MNKIWFKRKRYGYGWTPCTWEGWTVLLLWVIGFVYLTSKITKGDISELYLIFIYTAGLILMCIWKGEKPRWQWGEKDKE